MSFRQSFDVLKELIGEEKLTLAMEFKIKSPLAGLENTNWTKTAKIIGINPRITGTYWGIVKYAMTFPENAVHIMPLFETGDGSLYVQNSWHLNKDFFDENLAELGFSTCEAQLKFVVNILHALGKAVGFDALPHVDNFSEIVILNPRYFEWVKINLDTGMQDFTVDTNSLYKEIEKIIVKNLDLPHNTFQMNEKHREDLIFSQCSDRFERRMQIRKIIRSNGYEPVPVVEHAPMRPVVFEKFDCDEKENWAVFKVENKNPTAKIIGSMTPYKWYKINSEGYICQNLPEEDVWRYFKNKLSEFQQTYDFDFLRADMAHNQISHSFNGGQNDLSPREIWAEVKETIQYKTPYFGTFAEAFFSTYYIDGIADMQNKNFDIVLGNLNFQFLNDSYTKQIQRFVETSQETFFSPCLTVFTNDGDLPQHQKLFQSEEANEVRYFISMFLNFPGYMGMGFEVRNLEPQSDDEFSNYYVKIQDKKFKFGENVILFEKIFNMRILYEKYKPLIENAVLKFYKTNSEKSFCWSYSLNGRNILFAVNLEPEGKEIFINNFGYKACNLIYTNSEFQDICIEGNIIRNIYIGECVVYEFD